MATLSMGWRLDDINCVKNKTGHRTITGAKRTFSHEKPGLPGSGKPEFHFKV
jgi:hypothetical protein